MRGWVGGAVGVGCIEGWAGKRSNAVRQDLWQHVNCLARDTKTRLEALERALLHSRINIHQLHGHRALQVTRAGCSGECTVRAKVGAAIREACSAVHAVRCMLAACAAPLG